MSGQRERLIPISKTQKEMLIGFVKKNPNLRSGKFSAEFTYKTAKQEWENISQSLNSIPNGSVKDWKHWRKTWQDLKKNTKNKASLTKKHANTTGGGPPMPPMSFDNSENEILSVIAPVTIDGNTEVQESIIDFDEMYVPKEPETAQIASPLLDAPNEIIVEVDEVTPDVELVDHTYTRQEPAVDSPIKRARMNKSRRLEQSIKVNQSLLSILNQRQEKEHEFYDAKIAFMNDKRSYMTEKLKIMRQGIDILKSINEQMQIGNRF